jgi:ABC-type glycerol-3-phosphate transport system permease component
MIAKNSVFYKFRVHLLFIAFSFLMIYPVFWWLGASLKTLVEMKSSSIWPAKPIWENYKLGWHVSSQFSFTKFYINTLLMEFWNILGAVLTTGVVAYGFARLNFKLRGFWFSVLLLTMMLPGQVTIVPQYIMYNHLNLVNSYIPLILPHFFGGGAFFIFLVVQFIRGIPKELDESAKIDGASEYITFAKIIFPLIKPALVTVAIFTFIWSWDDFFGQVLYLSTVDKYSVSLALRMFIDQFEVQWGQLLAMSLVSVLPSTILFFLAQRHFVEGIATTGIKG